MTDPGRAARLAAALAAALAGPAALAQVSIAAAPEPGGAVLGRVCVDLDGDGRCGADEPGVAGARVLGEGGGVAVADGAGRFHLLEVPGRIVLRDRAAYGGHAVAAEGLGVTRAFELGPAGAAQVDLPVPAPRPAPAPELAVAVAAAAGGAPERTADGRLRYALAVRTSAGAAVSFPDRTVAAGPDGVASTEVLLAPGANVVGVGVVAGGGGAAYRWTIHLVRRPRGGDLVVPLPPERIATFTLRQDPGGAALVVGEAAAGARLRGGGTVAVPGRTAAWLPAESGTIEVVDGTGAVVARATTIRDPGSFPVAPRFGATGLALADLEVSFLGKPGVLVTGRGAAAGRAHLDGLTLEGGVDLDDRDELGLDLLRPRDAAAVEHALDPARTFLTLGDEGASDDRNPGRGRVWARATADGARLDLGGARAGLTGTELGRYDRALWGGKLRLDGEAGPVRLEAGAFGSTLREDALGNGPPRAVHDVLDATGGASFWLSSGEVVAGSEGIRIEWRDPFTGRIVAQRALLPRVDYELDHAAGRIVLAAPLATVAPPPIVRTGDPFAAPRARLVADYLCAAAGPAAEDLQGGRLGASAGPVSISAHAAKEDRGGGGYRLLGAAASLDLGPALRISAEAARSRGRMFERAGTPGFGRSDDGGLTFASGAGAPSGGDADALHVEASGGAGPVRAEAWWRERERGYSDAEFLEPLAARERGASVAARAGSAEALVRVAERRGADPLDPAGLAREDARQALARAGWRGERAGLAVEAVNARSEGARTGESTSAGVLGSWRVDPALALEVSHHQRLRLSGDAIDPTFSGAGVTFSGPGTSGSIRGGWGPGLGSRLLVSGARLAPGEAVYATVGADPDAPDVLAAPVSSALGVRQRAGGVELFSEEQLERDLLGLRQARVLGIRLEPLAGVTASLSGERGQRLRLDGSVADRAAAAGALGVVRGPLRLAARGELRDEGGDRHAGAGASGEWLVAAGVALDARVSWTHGIASGREALGFEAALGGAWRGAGRAAAATVSRIAEQRPGEARRDGVLARVAATADAGARVEAGLGAAVIAQEVAGARDDRIVGSARARVRVAGPLDAAAEYARRGPLGGGRLDALDAVRVEAGVSQAQSRIAVGYTLLGFGGDGLSPAADTSRLYVRAQLVY